MATIESWHAVRPSRVTREVLSKVAGSMQTWLIAALKYFQLIDEDNRPTPKLDALATATDRERPKLIAEMLRAGYPFLFENGVDLSNITYGDLKRKFEETGAQGETAVKAISFFTGMAKLAEMEVSPFVATRRRRTNGRRSPVRKPVVTSPASHVHPQPSPVAPPAAVGTLTPMQVLIDMLDVQDMDETEQAAVWTLIRYLKRGEVRSS